MAATTPNLAVTSESLITVKVAINGSNRRFKLPLKDLGANVLPDKLRFLLAIPPNQQVILERFSDSAGSYTTLDSNNPSVYKQLYRAAKAKLKLRIRATLVSDDKDLITTLPEASHEISTPVTCLDSQRYVPVPYPNQTVPAVGTDRILGSPSNESAVVDSAPSVHSVESPRRSEYYEHNAHTQALAFRKLLERRRMTESSPHVSVKANSEASTPTKQEPVGEAPVPSSFSTRESFFAELASISSHQPVSIHNVDRSLNIQGTYSVFCNECDDTIPGAHYHCSICDDGDFDLCQSCVASGVLCGGEGHWLIKRIIKNGKVINSTTETIAPRTSKAEDGHEVPGAFTSEAKPEDSVDTETRTCNSCVNIFPDSKFVTCTVCEDYDLCLQCLVSVKHGHHPSHEFKPATEDACLSAHALRQCAPGRNLLHFALCDGCDKPINGIRHKCMNCPDWDFCSTCVKNAPYIHPGHRFVPIYEIIAPPAIRTQKHHGIYCDGPLCKDQIHRKYITGDRYKCAVCHDTDFCASCEAIPINTHNRTHPLIKFKTPVRNVSVTTLGEKNADGGVMTMGDVPPPTSSKSTETTPSASSANAATQVQTVAEVKPSTPIAQEAQTRDEVVKDTPASDFQAHFIRDAVADGSKLPSGQTFEQVWTLRNPGPRAWPAGCSVRFVGGDNMLNVDLNRAASVSDIADATESNVIGRLIEVGEEVDFKVVMKTPQREGKSISYWRLKTADGTPFGHKLWCDIDVCSPKPTAALPAESNKDAIQEKEAKVDDKEVEAEEAKQEQSAMIFPKLDKESPVSSTHDIVQAKSEPMTTEEQDLLEEVESLELGDGETDDGFLTDEEYDILDASDEEFFTEAQKAGKK